MAYKSEQQSGVKRMLGVSNCLIWGGRWRLLALFLGLGLLNLVIEIAPADAAPLAYITNFDDNSVTVYDTVLPSLVTTIPVGDGPYGVAVHPAGIFVYVVNQNGDTVSVIDTATNTVTATVPVETQGGGIAAHPAGTFVYVTGLNFVSVIDTATNTVTATVSDSGGGNLGGVAVHPAGTFVYVTNFGSSDKSVGKSLHYWSGGRGHAGPMVGA